MAELPEERALRATVAVAEWVYGVELGEVVCEPVDERLALKPSQVVFFGEGLEHVSGVRLDVLRQAEDVGLGDGDGADLAGPVVEVAEDLAVERSQVFKIVRSGQRSGAEILDRGESEIGFGQPELVWIGDAEPIA